MYLTRLHGAPLAVKVYRLYRTSRRHGGPIKVDDMAMRAAFEFEMLRQAWKGGAAVPTPAKRVENLLAMRYLGGEEGPAPRLVDLAPVDPAAFRDELLAAVEALVLSGVVHGDLSAYNVLIHGDRPWFIDFSDSVRVDRLGSSPWQRLANASEALTRDLNGLASYFQRFGLDVDVASTVRDLVEKLRQRWEVTHERVRRPTPGPRPVESPAPP